MRTYHVMPCVRKGRLPEGAVVEVDSTVSQLTSMSVTVRLAVVIALQTTG